MPALSFFPLVFLSHVSQMAQPELHHPPFEGTGFKQQKDILWGFGVFFCLVAPIRTRGDFPRSTHETEFDLATANSGVTAWLGRCWEWPGKQRQAVLV